MNKEFKNRRKLLSPPGDTIQETIDIIGMNQYELAERIGKNIKNVNRIIKGKESISPETALALERVINIPADFWLERERLFQKEKAELKFDEEIEKSKSWIKNFPIKEMMKHKWIPYNKDAILILKDLLIFFGIAHPDQWKKIYENKYRAVAFRMSLKNINNSYAISAWLRQGERQSAELSLNKYQEEIFTKRLNDIKELSYIHPQNFHVELQKICSECGVAVVFTPNILHAPISGASRWIKDLSVPLIQLSGRYKTNDSFWFTFFHEAGHILLHGKKEIFLEKVEGAKQDLTKENEADKFAEKWLYGNELCKFAGTNMNIKKSDIIALARTLKIHPALIVGFLQHNKIIPQSYLNDLKIKINLFD